MKKVNKDQPEKIIFSGIKMTHPDRILAPTKSITKFELAKYYDLISDRILPHLVNRPLVLVRCPTSTSLFKGKECFFQKHYNKSFPKAIKSIDVGKDADYMTITTKAGLMALIQFNTLEIHPWGSTLKHLNEPDRITFDLDPSPEVPWKKVIESAYIIRDALKKLKLTSFVKTSGGKGLHIMIPIKPKYDWMRVKDFTEAFSRFLSEKYPDRFIATITKSKRTGKIFLDYLRNAKDATSVAAYSVRARQGAPVSMPIAWTDLKKLKSAAEFTVLNIETYLKKKKNDPWRNFFKCQQEIPDIK